MNTGIGSQGIHLGGTLMEYDIGCRFAVTSHGRPTLSCSGLIPYVIGESITRATCLLYHRPVWWIPKRGHVFAWWNEHQLLFDLLAIHWEVKPCYLGADWRVDFTINDEYFSGVCALLPPLILSIWWSELWFKVTPLPINRHRIPPLNLALPSHVDGIIFQNTTHLKYMHSLNFCSMWGGSLH